jgi:hypothetical protein
MGETRWQRVDWDPEDGSYMKVTPLTPAEEVLKMLLDATGATPMDGPQLWLEQVDRFTTIPLTEEQLAAVKELMA